MIKPSDTGRGNGNTVDGEWSFFVVTFVGGVVLAVVVVVVVVV